MSTPAEKRYVNAKLSYEELLIGLRRWPEDRQLRWAVREAKRRLNEERELFNVERYGRR